MPLVGQTILTCLDHICRRVRKNQDVSLRVLGHLCAKLSLAGFAGIQPSITLAICFPPIPLNHSVCGYSNVTSLWMTCRQDCTYVISLIIIIRLCNYWSGLCNTLYVINPIEV